MTVWSKHEFDLAAEQLGLLLCKYDLCHHWSYETDCLTVVSSRETGLNNHEHQTQSSESTSFDGDTIVLRDMQTTDWFVLISYSHIWRVPVLHFTVQTQDGTPLNRQDVMTCLMSYSTDPDSIDVASDFVSIDEHPVTGLPSYLLHPCQTASLLEIMEVSASSATLRLWSWMSMTLPVVGIAICTSTFCRIQEELGRE